MNILEIIELLKELNIKTETFNGKTEFFDEEEKTKMEVSYTKDKSSKEKLPITSLEELIKTESYMCLSSKYKNLKFQLCHPVINGIEDKNSIMIKDATYTKEYDSTIKYHEYNFGIDEKTMTYSCQEKEYGEHYSNEEDTISINLDGIVKFKRYGTRGTIDTQNIDNEKFLKSLRDNQFDPKYLDPQTMLTIVDDNPLSFAITKYYSNMYPILNNSLNKIKNFKKEVIKKVLKLEAEKQKLEEESQKWNSFFQENFEKLEYDYDESQDFTYEIFKELYKDEYYDRKKLRKVLFAIHELTVEQEVKQNQRKM